MASANLISAGVPGSEEGELLLPVASQWTLIRRRFFKRRLAVISGIVVATFYVVVLLADFLACCDPRLSNADRALVPPQSVHFFLDGRWAPHVLELNRSRDPETLSLRYTARQDARVPLELFARGYPYKFLGVIPTNVHLLGTTGVPSEQALFLFGTDQLGRDLYSRMLVGIRTSLTIGLVAVSVTLLLGMLMGAMAGFYGGKVDLVVQRVTEVLLAIPTIPLWMGLAAGIPPTWEIESIYLAVTFIISLIGWTQLARELRGRIMALRNEDFVLAAELYGASPARLMFVHLLPLCTSHIIATTTLALPAMISSETALGFLGLGLRAPAISLGVLLNGAQDVQAAALYPWLIWPAVPTAVIIMAFNFLGDGLRDAADPYA